MKWWLLSVLMKPIFWNILFDYNYLTYRDCINQPQLSKRYFDSVKSIFKQRHCRIWLNKKAKNRKWWVLNLCITYSSLCLSRHRLLMIARLQDALLNFARRALSDYSCIVLYWLTTCFRSSSAYFVPHNNAASRLHSVTTARHVNLQSFHDCSLPLHQYW